MSDLPVVTAPGRHSHGDTVQPRLLEGLGSSMDRRGILLVTMVAVVAAAPSGPEQVPLEGTQVNRSSNNASSVKLRDDFHSISTAILSFSRSDHSCPEMCESVLRPICLSECKRRWLAILMCGMTCYSYEMMCCHCPTTCHQPFHQCYVSCAENNTLCKDRCITKVNECCSGESRALHALHMKNDGFENETVIESDEGYGDA